MKKALFMTFRAAVTLFVWFMGGYALHRFEYFTAFGEIDNIIGMLPVALVLTGAAGLTALLWMKHTKQLLPLSVTVSLFVILSAVLFPTALRGNWWIGLAESEESESTPDLSVYAPFSADSKAAKLEGESTLRLSDSLPVLDGATALYPVLCGLPRRVL